MMTPLTLCLACMIGQAEPAAGRESLAQVEEAQRIRSALEAIDNSTESQEMVRHMTVVRKAFPGCRPILHEAVERGSPKLLCFAIQVLGELGEASKDLKVVSKQLEHKTTKVRLAAIMAVRQLGTEGYDALVKTLEKETDSNNRKMIVKTFQVWEHEAAVPVLVELLSSEKERDVRNFIVKALESITRRKLGDNLAAWQSHLESKALSEQAKSIAKPRPELPVPPLTTEEKKQ